MAYDQEAGTPGLSADVNLEEWHGLWGRPEWQYLIGNKRISGAARDAGNSVTTLLRAGLIMGEITSSKMLKEFNAAGTDGSQYPIGVLIKSVSTQANGADANSLTGKVAYMGGLKARDVLVPGEAAHGLAGKNNEFVIRNALAPRFTFDDGVNSLDGLGRSRSVTGATTLASLDHMALIDNSGAAGTIVVTLPTPKRGLTFRIAQVAGQIITVSSPATNEFVPVGGTPVTDITIAATVFGVYRFIGLSSTLYLASRESV